MTYKKIKHAIIITTLVISSLLTSFVASAQKKDEPVAVSITPPIDARSIPQLINGIIDVLLGVVGAIALIMFIYGGIMWMTSAGNEARITKGQETLRWATVGLIIIFSSYALLDLIFKALTGQ